MKELLDRHGNVIEGRKIAIVGGLAASELPYALYRIELGAVGWQEL
jgi:hypothetical protein